LSAIRGYFIAASKVELHEFQRPGIGVRCRGDAAFGIGVDKTETHGLIKSLHLDVVAESVREEMLPAHRAGVVDARLNQAARGSMTACLGTNKKPLHLACVGPDPAQRAPPHCLPGFIARDPYAAMRRQILVSMLPEVLNQEGDIERRAPYGHQLWRELLIEPVQQRVDIGARGPYGARGKGNCHSSCSVKNTMPTNRLCTGGLVLSRVQIIRRGR
jgi:hypothetical protein